MTVCDAPYPLLGTSNGSAGEMSLDCHWTATVGPVSSVSVSLSAGQTRKGTRSCHFRKAGKPLNGLTNHHMHTHTMTTPVANRRHPAPLERWNRQPRPQSLSDLNPNSSRIPPFARPAGAAGVINLDRTQQYAAPRSRCCAPRLRYR